MRLLKHVLRYLVIFAVCLLPVSAKAETAVLDLRREGNLKWIFDSGLRPVHVSLGRSLCDVSDVEVKFILPNGAALLCDVQNMVIRVYEDGSLASINCMLDGKFGRDEARKRVNVFSEAIAASRESFETFADETAAKKRRFIDVLLASREYDTMAVEWRVTPDIYSENPFAFRLFIRWKYRSVKNHGRAPIKPPVGYEHLSMERPREAPILKK